VVYKLRDLLVVEDGIGKNHALLWFCFSHFKIKKIILTGAVIYCSSTSTPGHLLNLFIASSKTC
jgi:hypothetical protein